MSADVLALAIRAAVDDAVAPLRAEIAELRSKLESRPSALVSRRVAAERLGVSVPTIDRYIRQGLLRASKVRRRVMVDPTSLPDAERLAARALHGLPLVDEDKTTNGPARQRSEPCPRR